MPCRVTTYERHDRAAGVIHRFRFVHDMPLNASHPHVRVNFLEYWEIRPHQVQHWSWVTDLRVHQRTVYHLMRGGRARWEIENETFNTLKNQGYHFEHNYGHGEQHLSVVFATLMMLAFLVLPSGSATTHSGTRSDHGGDYICGKQYPFRATPDQATRLVGHQNHCHPRAD